MTIEPLEMDRIRRRVADFNPVCFRCDQRRSRHDRSTPHEFMWPAGEQGDLAYVLHRYDTLMAQTMPEEPL